MTNQYVEQLDINLVYRTIGRSALVVITLLFSQNGFTAVRFCEMNENYNHQHQDVRKKTTFNTVIFLNLWTLNI